MGVVSQKEIGVLLGLYTLVTLTYTGRHILVAVMFDI